MYQTQKVQLLTELIKKKTKGVNSYVATYQMGIKQAPTRIKELKDQGYAIVTKQNSDRSVNWILLHIPQELRSPSIQQQKKAIATEQGKWHFEGGVARYE